MQSREETQYASGPYLHLIPRASIIYAQAHERGGRSYILYIYINCKRVNCTGNSIFVIFLQPHTRCTDCDFFQPRHELFNLRPMGARETSRGGILHLFIGGCGRCGRKFCIAMGRFDRLAWSCVEQRVFDCCVWILHAIRVRNQVLAFLFLVLRGMKIEFPHTYCNQQVAQNRMMDCSIKFISHIRFFELPSYQLADFQLSSPLHRIMKVVQQVPPKNRSLFFQ